MPRSNVCRAAAAFARPVALQSPFEANTVEPRQWFKFQNKADTPDTTDIYIYDMIGGWFGVTADEFIYQLKQVSTPNVTLHVNSPGGEVFEAVAIYNAIRNHDAHFTAEIDALAASAASFLIQAADTIVMNKGSMLMIHDALMITYGNEKDHLDSSSILSKVSDNIADIYATRAGGTDTEWRETMRAEAWFTAKEAVDANLADKVSEKPGSSDTKNNFDLSAFNYAGRQNAPSPFAIMNQAKKEALVPKSKNEETVPTEPAPQEPEQPETPGAPGSPEVPAEPNEEPDSGSEEGSSESGEGDESGDGGSGSENAAPKNAAGSFYLVNGKRVSNAKAVQDHINSLEGFHKDTQDQNRKDFVEQLARDNKISASQIEKLTTYALSLKTSEEFDNWSATYSDSVPNPTFNTRHSSGVTNPSGDATEQSALDKSLETASAIVAQHRSSNMKQEQLEKTASYKLLKEHNRL